MSRVTGFRETAAALRKLAKRPPQIVNPAIRKSLQPMLKASKQNLKANNSYHRGVLSRSMAIRKLKSGSSLAQWVIAATGRGIGIAHLVEAGTEPHYQPKRHWMHPGAKAKPFLEPAFFAHDEEAVQIFGREVGQQMVAYASSVAYRGR